MNYKAKNCGPNKAKKNADHKNAVNVQAGSQKQENEENDDKKISSLAK